MKFKLSAVLFIIQNAVFGNTYTVDNTPFSGAHYSNLQTAIDSASSGDSLIVMPSFNTYGKITINKKLNIYSRGVHGFKVSPDKSAMVELVEFVENSNGSIFQGFNLIVGTTSGMILTKCENISILHNFFNSTYLNFATGGSSQVSNVQVKGNIFWNSVNQNQQALAINGANYCDISNNYFIDIFKGSYFAGIYYSFIVGGNSSNSLRNNFFALTELSGTNYYYQSTSGFFRNSSAVFRNNIFWTDSKNITSFDSTSSGGDYRNNITYSRYSKAYDLPGTNYNDTLPEFETDFSGNKQINYDLSYNFRLKSSSVGKNGGTDSTDVGLYGGGYAFGMNIKSKGVAIFEEFEILNPVVKKGGPLKVKIMARKPEQ
jgi:hypothetical protein